MKKFISIQATAFLLLTLIISAKTSAQAFTSDSVKAQLVKEWERAKNYTVVYLNTMPTDKYSFKAQDSIRSFAQQMLHLAQANFFLMSAATGQQAPAYVQSDMEHNPGAQTKDSIMYYVTASYDFCANAVKNSDMSKWGEKTSLFGMQVSRFGLMIKTFEHQTHHRGQTTIYIRLQGIHPPQEMLF